MPDRRIRNPLLAVTLAVLTGCVPAVAPGDRGDGLRAVPFTGVQNVFGRNAVGDAIVITAVRGPVDRVEVGRTYQVDGAYTLASHDAATLSAYETGTGPHTVMIDGQSAVVRRGSGTFRLRLGIDGPGRPHVSLYPTGGGSSFAGEYFGTGPFLPPAAWRVDSNTPVVAAGSGLR